MKSLPWKKLLLPLGWFARNRTLVTGAWLWVIFGVMSWRQPDVWLYPGAFYEQAASYLEWGSPERAFQTLEMALRYDPDNPAYHVTQGYLALKLDKLDEAEERFRVSLRLRPEDDEARLGLGQVMANKGRWLEAMDALAACTTPSLTLDQRVRRGKIYLQLGVSHLALEDFQAVLARLDSEPEMIEEIWRVSSTHAEWDEVAPLWQRLARRAQNPETTRRALAKQSQALRNAGELSEALAILEQIPTPENLRTRAQMALEMGEDAKAEEFLRELQAQSGDSWTNHEFAHVLNRRGKTEEASQLFARLVRAAPQDTGTLSTYAWLLNLQGRHREAWQTVSSLQGWRKDSELLRLRAKTAFWAGENGAALEAYRLLNGSDSKDVAIQSELALILTRLLNFEAAEVLYRKLIEAGAGDAEVRSQYAWLLNSQKRYREAWELVRELDPRDSKSLVELQARTALWNGELRVASARFEEIARGRPGDPEVWQALGEAYGRMENEAEQTRAWQRYLELRPEDDEARLWLARSFTRSNQPARAEAHYRTLLGSGRAGTDLVVEAAQWFESQGMLRDATEQYLKVLRRSEPADPELYLRLGRLHHWTHQPGEAAAWYRAFLAESRSLPAAEVLQARAEFADILLETGRPDASLAEAQTLLAAEPDNAQWLLLGARAASEQQIADLTVGYLERLSRDRRLSDDEQLWLAGQYRTAGEPRKALSLLESVRANGRPLVRRDLEALADLRAEFGHPQEAIGLYQDLLAEVPETRLQIKLARVAGKVGPPDLAARSFRTYLDVYPTDWEAQLSAARFFSSAGQYGEALEHYLPYVRQEGSHGLELELAAVSLGAERFEEGEHWARLAVRAEPDNPRARLTLGQALHLNGKGGAANKILSEIANEQPDDPETLLWLGHAQMARNRHLAAFLSIEHAIQSGGNGPEYHMAQGDAAMKRGDFGRSQQSFRAAEEAGVNPAAAKAAREKLDAETRSTAAPVASMSGDSHGLRTRQVSADWNFRPTLALPLSLHVARGEVWQASRNSAVPGETRFSRSSAGLSSGTMFVKPQFGVSFSGGLERFGAPSAGGSRGMFQRGSTAVTGQVEGRYFFRGGSEAAVRVSRESLWSGYDRRDPRNFNRIRDLSGVAPNFTLTGVQGNWIHVSKSNKRLQINTGFDNYQDSNRRTYLYTHYQIPLKDSYSNWTVVRPNFYIETYRRESPYYFSPGRYMTGGVMLHTVRKFGDWTVEGEVNPRLVGYEDAVGIGAHAVFDIRKEVGRVEVGGGGFFSIEQRTGYKQWRFSGGVTIPLGGK